MITLHTYYNDQAVQLDPTAIDTIQEYGPEADAAWGPEHGAGLPYTKVSLKAGARTSEGVGNAYVRESQADIIALGITEPA